MTGVRASVSAGLVLLAGILGCGETDPSTNEDTNGAIEELARRGLALTDKAFLKNVKVADREVLDLYLRAGMSASEALPDAAIAKRCELLPWLFERGADAESRPAIRALAVARSRGLAACAEELEVRGTSIDLRDRSGATELVRAAGSRRCRALSRLLEAGADVDAATEVGSTALMAAAAAGEIACVRALIEAGAEVEARDRDGWTALAFAAERGSAPVVRALLDAGAEVDPETVLGWTPLALAAVSGHGEAALHLLSAGADPARPLPPGSPIEIAAREGWGELAPVFSRARADGGTRQ